MDLKEVKEKFPGVEVLEFRSDAVYLLLFDENDVSSKSAIEVGTVLNQQKIPTLILMCRDPREAVRALELKP